MCSQNKQRIFPYTILAVRFLWQRLRGLTLFVPMCSILYTNYLYFYLTHLLLTLKVNTRRHVSALSGHHQALL
jgi:hypothetical protein